jgi:Zn-dependent peptidase ImmA (M78 family)
MPVEDIQWVIQSMYDRTIEKYQVPFEGTFPNGLMERYENNIKIYIKKNIDEDHKQFAAVKELCHVIIDETED